jgi:hypothetical protein
MRSTSVGAVPFAIVFAMISLSEVASSSTLSGNAASRSSALVRLPLWAKAKAPAELCSTNGWALTTIDEPLVEYRV